MMFTILCVNGLYSVQRSWLRWLERRERVCVEMNVPGSSPGQILNFLLVYYFTSYCTCWIPFFCLLVPHWPIRIQIV